jgi:hypothetical protein
LNYISNTFFWKLFYYFVSSVVSAATVTSSISILAGLLADTTISLRLVRSSNLEDIPKSETLITSPISANFDKSTSKESTKSLGKTFTSTSLICSSKIAPSFTAFELPIKDK